MIRKLLLSFLFLLLPFFGIGKNYPNYINKSSELNKITTSYNTAFFKSDFELNKKNVLAKLPETALACSYSVTTAVASDACEVGKISTVTLTSTAAGLPVGTYTVEYYIYDSNQKKTTTLTVTTAGTGLFSANVSEVGVTATASINITKITDSSNCSTNISKSTNTMRVIASKGKPGVQQGNFQCDKTWIAQWSNESVDGYYLDVALDNAFTNFLPGYNNKDVGNVISWTITGLEYGGTYYYRVRSRNYCGTSPNSDTITFNILGNGSSTPGTITGGATTVCVGAITPAFIKDPNSNPSTGEWSVFNQTGSATISTAGVVTGVSPGIVKVVFTTKNGGCGSSSTKTLTVTGGIVGAASSAPTLCAGTPLTAITHTTSGFTGIGTSTNLPPGITASFNNNTITITGTPTTAASGTYNYSIQLNGSCGNANATGTIKVNAAPAITTQPTAPSATCSGTGTQTITVVATGTNLTYVWKQSGSTITNGGIYSGQGTPILTLTNPTTANQGNYTVEISGDCTATPVISNQVAVTVNSAPAITTQPSTPAATCSGSGTQSMTVVASGTGPLTYQWKKDGTNLTNGGVVGGATTATLTLTNPTTANQGSYTVQISGSCAPAVTSTAVPVTVNSAPSITTQPATPAATCSGNGSQSMTVVASGAGLTYQWQKDGSNLTNGTVVGGATSATLTLTNPTASDAGSYTVVVTGTCSSAVTSTARTVTVYTPTITTTPQAKTCANRRIAYDTQGGKSNYIWSVSGVLNTDYKLIDRGTSTDSYIVIEWLTTGSKTVSVNYTNANGCTTSTPGTYTTEIVILDKGQVNGGKHICPSETLPQLTFNTYANSSVRYPDTSVIVKWQYSDGNNTNYQDIPGTAGQTTYTPTSIPGTTRQYRVVVDNGTCSDQSIYSAIDIDVTTAITASSTAGQSVCSGAPFTPISVTAVGTPRAGQSSIEYQWYSSVQSNMSSPTLIAGATSNTYTPLSTTVGTLYYYCIVRGQCGTVTSSTSGAFVTNAKPTAPAAIVSTQPTCSGTKGTITITATAGYTYSINGTDYYNQSVFSSLDPNTYIVTAKNASGCISTTGTSLQVNTPTSKTWTGATSTDWNVASNWSPSGIPSATDCVIIPTGVTNSPIISNANIEANAYTLTVNDRASLVVETANTLRVNSAVKVLSSGTSTGSLLFKNNSSLIQIDTDPNINSGSISYIRNSLPIRQADYVYWSTPVKGQTLEAVSSATANENYLAYNGSQWVGLSKTTVMTVGKGYIIRGPETYSNTNRQAFSATFTGTPNNGTLSGETVVASKYYLVGNPYPSALDANKFILDVNNRDILKGTLYFWTHNTPVVLGSAYKYNTDDYASYNVTGGVRTAAKTGIISGNNGDAPTGQIGAGQSFFVGTKAAGTITFNNTMRSGGSDNSQFFKPGTSKSTAIDRNRLWLNMTNEGGAFKQLLVGYIEGATNDVEAGFDGATFDGNKYLDFYSINGNSKLVIQGRALPFTDADTVPLGYKTTIAGDFTIAIDEVDGNMTTQKIYLEDKTTAEVHDLTASNYTFTTLAGTFPDRFVLRYTNKSLGTGDFENIENGVLVSLKDKIVKVLSSKENLKEVNIYDISGKLLYNKTKIESNELQVSNLQSSNQVLIVKVTLENGFTVSKKIIFE